MLTVVTVAQKSPHDIDTPVGQSKTVRHKWIPKPLRL